MFIGPWNPIDISTLKSSWYRSGYFSKTISGNINFLIDFSSTLIFLEYSFRVSWFILEINPYVYLFDNPNSYLLVVFARSKTQNRVFLSVGYQISVRCLYSSYTSLLLSFFIKSFLFSQVTRLKASGNLICCQSWFTVPNMGSIVSYCSMKI